MSCNEGSLRCKDIASRKYPVILSSDSLGGMEKHPVSVKIVEGMWSECTVSPVESVTPEYI
eukprot:10847397-Karenia_brevis.AAC.1